MSLYLTNAVKPKYSKRVNNTQAAHLQFTETLKWDDKLIRLSYYFQSKRITKQI